MAFLAAAPLRVAALSASAAPLRARCARRPAAARGARGARRAPRCAAAPDAAGKAGDAGAAGPAPGRGPAAWAQIVPDTAANRSLWALAACGGLWTLSNLMVVAILPIYMRSELGLSSTKIGALEGAAIAAAFCSKVFSGVVSDAVGSRVGVILCGAVMTAAVKPMFACAGGVNAVWGGVVAFQFICATKIVDRLSKGVRAAPTDALLADLSPGAARGRSYSLNQSLSTLGGFAGSLACSAAMYITGNSYTLTFVTATVPALLAIALLVFAVKQPRLAAPPTAANVSAARAAAPTAAQAVGAEDSLWDKLRAATRLSGKFYFSALVVSLLYLARFSESFVMLRARSVGTPLAMIPLIATANQLVQGLLTYPMGLVADLCSARVVLAIGWAMIILAHLVFATVPNALGSVLGFVLVAAHMSMTQANSKSMISQNLEPHQRGAGFAAFSVISGVALAAGNILAGWCNDVTVAKGLGMVGCFYSGFVWSSLSLALLLAYFAVYRSEDALATGKRDD